MTTKLENTSIGGDESTKWSALLAKLIHGRETIGSPKHRPHADFNSSYPISFKCIFMSANGKNEWNLSLNNGQYLFTIQFPKHCILEATRLVTGEVEFFFVNKAEDGSFKIVSEACLVLHGVPSGERRYAAQEKIFGYASMSEGVIEESIFDAIKRARNDPDAAEKKKIAVAAAALSAPLWPSETNHDNVVGDQIWHCSVLEESMHYFSFPKPISPGLSQGILAIGGRQSIIHTFTSSGMNVSTLTRIKVNSLNEETSHMDLWPAKTKDVSELQFVIIRRPGQPTFIVNLGHHRMIVMGKTSNLNLHDYLPLAFLNVYKKLSYAEIEEFSTEKEFIDYVLDTVNPYDNTRSKFAKVSLYNNIVIEVGKTLLRFSI